jgi:hypothetical protein
MGVAKHDDMVDALSADGSDQPFATPFCQGDLGAIGLSRMPIVRSRRRTATP